MKKSYKGRFFSLFSLIIIFAFLSLIIACGGGGGGSSSDTDGDGTIDINNSTLTLEITSNTVTFGTPVTVTATLTNAAGEPAPNTVVTFTAANAIVAFTPAAGTALTDEDGVATVTLNAADIDSAGATSLTASAQVTFQDAMVTTTSSPLGITVGGAEITLGTITVGTSPISAYGTSSVSVPVLIGGTAATVPISVNFNSPCVSSGKAEISSPVTSSAGVATSTYTDKGCASGTASIIDTITASAGDDTATATITVNPTAVSNISFISATPTVIGTSTASATSLLKSSAVKFQVVDSNNQGKPGVGVTFSMLPPNYAAMGITFSPATATSDANGYVTTSVRSGTVPTPVWVVATVTGSSPVIKTQSNSLTITTGLPAQNSFSLSVGTYNIEGWRYDGVTTTLTIIASDRLGNPVPDGTAINFISEGASISNGSTQASCTTTNGTCTITLTSSAYKPTDGRVTILAYAVGEKSFIDANGNNSYEAGETFYDVGDIYLDEDEDGIWDTGEQFFSYVAGTNACLTRPAATALPYDWDISSKENSCNRTWGTNYVRRSTVIVLSGSAACVNYGSDFSCVLPYTVTLPMGSSCTRNFTLGLYDEHGNAMPAGTTVAASNNEVYYSYITGTPAVETTTKATTTVSSGSPVLSTNGYGTAIGLTVSGGEGCKSNMGGAAAGSYYPQGTFNIGVTTPKGIISTIQINVTGDTK